MMSEEEVWGVGAPDGGVKMCGKGTLGWRLLISSTKPPDWGKYHGCIDDKIHLSRTDMAYTYYGVSPLHFFRLVAETNTPCLEIALFAFRYL